MTIFKWVTQGLIMAILSSCALKPSIEQLQSFSAIEEYPFDNYLDTVSNKRALIIVAHDDDDCAMSGTIAKLSASGWYIKQLSLQSHLNPETGKNAAHIICNGNELILEDGIYRPGLDTMKNAYIPIPYEKIKRQFLHNKVAEVLTLKVNDFNPTVIFTLDNIKGGYGHPEHIFISQLVLDLLEADKINTKRIYQSVYTSHMEEEIVDKWLKIRMENWGYPHASDIANEMYGIDGMPEPTVQVSIKDYAETKMEYLRAYPESVRRNLRKFIPYYEEFDAQVYFSVFDKEFFRVIERKMSSSSAID